MPASLKGIFVISEWPCDINYYCDYQSCGWEDGRNVYDCLRLLLFRVNSGVCLATARYWSNPTVPSLQPEVDDQRLQAPIWTMHGFLFISLFVPILIIVHFVQLQPFNERSRPGGVCLHCELRQGGTLC